MPLGGMDEIRNYNLSRGIVMGYIPYKDFNMVMVPLFNLAFALPLLISRTLVTFRITSAVCWVLTYIAYYKYSSAKIGHELSTFVSAVSVIFFHQYNYNSMVFLGAVLFALILQKELTYKRAFLLGIIGILAALSRQTSGTILLLMGIFFVIKAASSGKKLRMFISYMSGVGVVGILFLIYLLATSSFMQFWDYCLFALFLPGGNGSLFTVDSVPALLITAAGLIVEVASWRKNKEASSLYHILLGAALLTIAIPLVDEMHIVFSGMWFAVPAAGAVYDKAKDKLNSRIVYMLVATASAVILIFGFTNLRGTQLSDKYREFKLIPVSAGITEGYGVLADHNKELEEQGYHVTVFLHEAAMLSVMNEEFNPPYDLFLKGNIGTVDAQYYWDAALEQENAVILTSDEYYVSGWQSPDGTLEYIKDHCEPVAEFAQFTWYMPAEG